MRYPLILPKLSERKTRYLVVGAVGALLSGYFRTTADLDLLIDLNNDNLEKFLDFAKVNGYLPRAPVPAEELKNSIKRQEWHEKKGLKAFSFYDPKDPFGNIDLLIYSPVNFEEAWTRKQTIWLNETQVYVASLDDLIELKEDAIKNRTLQKDLYDLEALKRLRKGV